MGATRKLVRPLGALALAFCPADAALAQGFSIESAVLDSRSAKNLGVTSEQGQMTEFFKAQKAVTFGILRAAGISLDQLPPEIRARIERFQTTNLEAFRAFSDGLDLKDQGRFAEAKEKFRRAAELDPNFGLAGEQQQAMPDVNIGSGLQMRAVIAAASNNAVDRGRQGYTVDLAHALAALQAGQAISVAATPAVEQAQAADYSVNPPGSGDKFAQNLVAGVSYTYSPMGGTGPVSIAITSEWPSGKYNTNGAILESVTGNGLDLQRGTATISNGGTPGSLLLADGATTAYWGTWLSSGANAASLMVQGSTYTAGTGLGNVDYVMAQATRQMPGNGIANFSAVPLAGSLGSPTGTIQVNFANQTVDLLNLGFNLNGLTFSGLTGTASYVSRDPVTGTPLPSSGAFNGNYTAGSCTGCSGFLPQSSVFTGNFVGRNADGLVFSTIMLTGTGTGTASGVQLFKKP
jgi:hypothetical protein